VNFPLSHPAALLTAYTFVGALVVIVEALRRRSVMNADAARAAIHVGVGLFVFPTLVLFEDWRVGIIPPASFVVVNFLIHRFRLIPALAAHPANLGTVFFPLSFALLLALFWRPGEPGDMAPVAVAGILAMALGDAAAAMVGKRWGSRRYVILGHSRTMEGSLALFLVTAAAVAAVLHLMAEIPWHPAIAFGLVTGTAAAGIESVCPFGSDNLFVPLGAAGLLYALLKLSESALGIG